MNFGPASAVKKPILLIDDDDIDVMGMERQLKKLSIFNPIIRKKNGVDAINFLHEDAGNTELSAILLDLNMPKKNGIEFLTELRQELPEVDCNIYVITTSDSVDDQKAANALQVSGFIFKQDIESGLREIEFDD